MTAKAMGVVLALGLAVLAAGCGRSSNISRETDQGIPSAKMESMFDFKADSPVHSIVMPYDEPVFPPGPGRDEFVTACVVSIHRDTSRCSRDFPRQRGWAKSTR